MGNLRNPASQIMPLSFACPCGQHLEIDDSHAGQPISCPACAQVVTVPSSSTAVVGTFKSPPPAAIPVGSDRPAPLKPQVVEEDDEPSEEVRPQRPKSERKEERIKDPVFREMMAKARKEVRTDAKQRKKTGGGIVISGGIATGMIMILIAVVWLVAGLASGVVFMKRIPILLLILGVVAVFKGMMGMDDDGFHLWKRR